MSKDDNITRDKLKLFVKKDKAVFIAAASDSTHEQYLFNGQRLYFRLDIADKWRLVRVEPIIDNDEVTPRP